MAGVDRLSALPLEIKTSILCFLPIDEAVRTSSLSRSWHHVWTHLSSLTFAFNFPSLPDDFNAPKVVEHVISSIQGPVIDFGLCYNDRCYTAGDLHRLLYLIYLKGDLKRLKITNLLIGNNGCMALINLPYFHSLTFLRLSLFRLCLPNNFQGFEHLTVLYLESVFISQRDIQLLIEQSKNLKSFHGFLYSADTEALSLTFNSPLLNLIDIVFTQSIKEVRVIAAPCLGRVEIFSQIGPTSSEECAFIAARIWKLLADIAIVPNLLLDFETFQCLSTIDASCLSRVHFQRLKTLHLARASSSIDERSYATFCYLIRNMPILESIQITCCGILAEQEDLDEPDAFPLNLCTNKENEIGCFGQSLRKLTISVTKSIHIVIMEMIRFILLNANALKLVEIIYEEGNEVEPSRVEELNLINKASSDVSVVFFSTSSPSSP